MVEVLLKGSEVRLEIDYFLDKAELSELAKKIVYTGKIDEFYEYQFGNLDYRSLKFQHELLNIENFQGNAVVNYTDAKIPFTRIIEHKHFEFGTQSKTLITREFSKEWEPGDEPYYPINDAKNETIYKNYQELANLEQNVIFGGRLAEYKYYDMHQIVESAINKFADQ